MFAFQSCSSSPNYTLSRPLASNSCRAVKDGSWLYKLRWDGNVQALFGFSEKGYSSDMAYAVTELFSVLAGESKAFKNDLAVRLLRFQHGVGFDQVFRVDGAQLVRHSGFNLPLVD